MKPNIAIREVRIGVAIILEKNKRLLWTWNERWGCFPLPMSKLRRYPGVTEPASRVALCAAVEALGVPAIVGEPFQGNPTLEVSQSDGEAKSYHHTAFPTLPHPAFATRLELARLSLADRPGSPPRRLQATFGQRPRTDRCPDRTAKLADRG